MIRDKSGKDPARLPKGVIAVAPPSFRRERALIKRGVWPVAGCDEAGRGPLAGPVVAAAVVLDPKRIPKGIDDSKRLTAERRRNCSRKFAPLRRSQACIAGADRSRQYPAGVTLLARAAWQLERPKHVRLWPRPPDNLCDCEAVIGATAVSRSRRPRSSPKSRDRLMCKLPRLPGLAEQHKGYGVPEHRRRNRLDHGASSPLACAGRGGT
jgi:ribonuclease HII